METETRSKLFGSDTGKNMYRNICPLGTFIKEFQSTSSDNLNGLDILCSDGSLLTGPKVYMAGGTKCMSKSENGFDGVEILPGRVRDTDAILYYKPTSKKEKIDCKCNNNINQNCVSGNNGNESLDSSIFNCPEGTKLVGTEGKSEMLINSMRFICRNVEGAKPEPKPEPEDNEDEDTEEEDNEDEKDEDNEDEKEEDNEDEKEEEDEDEKDEEDEDEKDEKDEEDEDEKDDDKEDEKDEDKEDEKEDDEKESKSVPFYNTKNGKIIIGVISGVILLLIISFFLLKYKSSFNF